MSADYFTLDTAITHAKCMAEDDLGTTHEEWQKIAEYLKELKIRRNLAGDSFALDVQQEWNRRQNELWKHASVTAR